MNECKIMNKISEDNKIWAKVLHEKQNFEDDYFPENYFLADLQRNGILLFLSDISSNQHFTI